MTSFNELFEAVLAADEVATLDPAARRAVLAPVIEPLVSAGELDAALDLIEAHIQGPGPLAPLLRDTSITDILINGPSEVYVERAGRLERVEAPFADGEELRAWAVRLVSQAGGRLDDGHPIADACLPDGARLHVVLPPLAPDGPVVSIRRFALARPTLDDLVAAGTLGEDQALGLRAAFAAGATIAIGGPTGSGKTTMLNALLRSLPRGERAVVIEETRELDLSGLHAVSLVTRPANLEGRGGVEMAALVRAALRMRPDRIVIGEVRGAEVFDALRALSSGHSGSLVTVHARSAADICPRLVELALSAPGAWSERAITRAVERAIDVVVHLERTPSGRRVSERQGLP